MSHNIRGEKRPVEFGLVSKILKLSNCYSINPKGEKDYFFNYRRLKNSIPATYWLNPKVSIKQILNSLPRPALEATLNKLRR